MNKYLNEFQGNQMTYKFYLSDKAVLEGSYKLFGTKNPTVYLF